MLFRDYRQAFDSVHRLKLLDAMESFGIQRKVVNLTQNSLLNSEATIIYDWRDMIKSLKLSLIHI